MAVLGCVQVGQLNVLLPGSNSGANFSWLLVNQCFRGNRISQVGQLDVLLPGSDSGANFSWLLVNQHSMGQSHVSGGPARCSFCRAPTQCLLRPIWRASGARPAMSAGTSIHRACYFIT
ncbi:hypothetical protein AVEN_15973-1 [Araneus ventricosus]|uniref:Uncharacterized protein n=1 Tax=Araneus ventricosus TaxID=182803 RepID=A0A4Y2TVI5_ARAVE|nr:hypothetical protein AVEN_15973-1 [Araneus ventricosus]